MVDPICPKGMVLQKPEGAVHPDEPTFCIEVEEVSQEEDNAFRAERARTGFELLIRLRNGQTEKKASASESPLRTIAAAQVQRNDVSGIDIGPVVVQIIPQPEGKLAGPGKPAVLRTQGEAEEYCKWKYPNGGSLPTERQWENACGKGEYCTASGKLKHTEARFDNSKKGPGNVDWYPVNARGTRNMTGNVWEWTSNTSDGLAVIRGGSWSINYFFGLLRADLRNDIHPDDRDGGVGWRCVARPQ